MDQISPDTPPSPSRGDTSAKSQAPASHAPIRSRRYPTPPALPLRLLLLCLRPESWAEAARYPTRITILPLFLAILIAGIAIGIGESSRALAHMRTFAANYDALYPPLEFSNGTLRATRDLPQPIRFDHPTGGSILVDPTGKTAPDHIKSGPSFFISDRDLWIIGGNDSAPVRLLSLSTLAFPTEKAYTLTPSSAPPPVATAPAVAAAAPAPVTINTQTLTHYIHQNSLATTILWTFFTTAFTGAVNSIWAILIMVLICPLVLLAAAGPRIGDAPDRRLILPRRAAYRISAALLVPLIIFGGFMHAAGKPLFSILGFEGATLFWFFAAAALALWSGFLAKRMYTPPAPARRAT